MARTNLEEQLLQAMDNAMCGDYCYDLNCRGCQEARLIAMTAVVFHRVQERWEQLLGPLRVMAADDLLPKSVVREIASVTKALKQEGKL